MPKGCGDVGHRVAECPKGKGGGKSKGSIATMEESWDGSDWGTYGQEPDKEHENWSMYGFIASIEHAPGTAGTEDLIGACAPEPVPSREHLTASGAKKSTCGRANMAPS